MSEFLKKLNSKLREFNCLAIFLNHIAEQINMGGGGRPGVKITTTPGGRALKFYASMRIEYIPIGHVKGKVFDPLTGCEVEVNTASNVRVKVVKNKVAPPFRIADVRVAYGRGFDNFYTALQVLIAYKRIVYTAGYFYFEKSPTLIRPEMPVGATKNQRPYLRGEAKLYDFRDAHPDWSALVIQTAEEILSQGSPPPSVPDTDGETVDSVAETEHGIVDLVTGELFAPDDPA